MLMLTLSFIASFVVAIAFYFGVEFKDVNAELLKAPLNGYVDWDNSIYLVGNAKQVNIPNLLTQLCIKQISEDSVCCASFWHDIFLLNQHDLLHKIGEIC
jgi:hypothetical protein